MKISSLRYANFRNFRDPGEIIFSTDGKVTIIYGENGDGKTTLHQLFRWIFFDKISFNRTATTKLYNLSYVEGLEYDATFEVKGEVEFEHKGELYSLTRIYSYKKELRDASVIDRKVFLTKMDNDNNWKPIDNAEEVINKLLPEELSEYFFFDGESMIADLKLKEKDSAGKLKKALYSMFDLDVLEKAVSHIGDENKSTSVLGKLYTQKENTGKKGEIFSIKSKIDKYRNLLEQDKEKVETKEKARKDTEESIKKISETIGGKKSEAEYEKNRKDIISNRDLLLDNANKQKVNYGDLIIEMFPKLLISKAAKEAEMKIDLEIRNNKLPIGLNRELVEYLLSNEIDECICGHTLGDKEKGNIRSYLDLLPPKSYANLYNQFVRTYESWGKEYDKGKIKDCLMSVINNIDAAAKFDDDIDKLDEEKKQNGNIENLIIERQKKEAYVDQLNKEIEDLNGEIVINNRLLEQYKKKYDNLTDNLEINKKVERKISIIKQVAEHFNKELEEAAKEYSQLLEENIQTLLNEMLTSKRIVKVTPEFSVRVMDNLGDESKSEGQFAIVSFAYIGGILSMLHSKSLENKEYPLVLDGPFSKLDAIQRSNVVKTLPKFAPQVIIFSKDNLQDIFLEEKIGRVWTIESNDAKNIAEVKEGFLWK